MILMCVKIKIVGKEYINLEISKNYRKKLTSCDVKSVYFSRGKRLIHRKIFLTSLIDHIVHVWIEDNCPYNHTIMPILKFFLYSHSLTKRDLLSELPSSWRVTLRTLIVTLAPASPTPATRSVVMHAKRILALSPFPPSLPVPRDCST